MGSWIGLARLLAATAAVCALLAPPASAAWEEPKLITSTADRGWPIALDANARGDRILVWMSGGGFAFSQAAPGAGFAAPQAIGPTDRFRVSQPRVELDERGNALLVWSYLDETDPGDRYDVPCCDGLRARVIRRDGSVTPAKTLAPVGSSASLVDMDIHAGGRIGVLFRAGPGLSAGDDLQARLGTVARGLGARERVASPRAFGIAAAVSLAGSRARVIYPVVSESVTEVRELERLRHGSYRRLRSALRTRIPPHGLSFATASNGRQAVAGLRDAGQGGLHVYAATRERGQRFGLNRVATDRLSGTGPTVAVEPAGNAVAAWGSLTPVPPASFDSDRIASSLRRPGGVFDTAAYRAPPSGRFDSGTPVAADVSASGRALLAWTEPSGEGRPGSTVTAAFRNPDGSTSDLSTLATYPDSHTPSYAVAVDRTGLATFAYRVFDDLYVVEGRVSG